MSKPSRENKGIPWLRLLMILAVVGTLVAIFNDGDMDRKQPAPPPPPVAAPTPATAPTRAAAPAAAPAAVLRPGEPWPPIDTAAAPPQTEALLRKNYYVILDGSGSMRDKGCSGNQTKFAASAAALKDFFATMPTDANVGLLVFDQKGFGERVPLGIGNRPQLQAALNAGVPEGGTPLSGAVEAGYKALTAQASRQLGYGEYHLVVVTDGEASPGHDPTPVVNRVLNGTAIVIHTIGFCIGQGHSLNQPGRTLYSSVDNARSLSRELQAVLAEAETFDVSQFR